MFIKNLKEQVENNQKNIMTYPESHEEVDYMYKEDWTNKLDSFYTYTHELDKSRTQNHMKLFPS